MKVQLLALTAIILVSGCSTVHVTRDYDQTADFGRLQTFAWKHEQQPVSGNPRVDNDLIDARIRTAVNTALVSKGFRPAAPADADFLLAYFMEYKRKLEGSSISFGLGGGRYGSYGGVGYSSDLSEYDEGVLTIDVLDAATRKTIWRGVGTRVAYDSANAQKVSKITNDAVARILAGFPPEEK